MPFENTVEISAHTQYSDVYQIVRKFLDDHFYRLPPVKIFYDASGHIKTAKRGYRQIILDLANGDAIGLLYKDDTVELDAVSASMASEFATLYGYKEN